MSGYERIPHLIVFSEVAPFKDTYAGEIGRVALTAQMLRPADRPSKTVVVFMHPIGGQSYLPLLGALAKAGVHVLSCDSRYRGVDSALIMEKVVIDLGAAVREAKERLGYERVVLGGWSGGGSLSLFYQAEAERPTVRETPAGDPLDLAAQGLIPADGVMLLAAHVSRHGTLTEWLDASVVDEADPGRRDRELDLYDPASPNQPPYSPDFIQRYRAAQIARNRRITTFVKERLEAFRRAGKPTREHCFVVHRTMADPRWLDPGLDPNERRPRWCYLGDPEIVNESPIGLARYTSLRSWLSQFSYDDARADGEVCAARITAPTLVLDNSADDACTPSHAQRLYDALLQAPRARVTIEGANHYYFGQPEKAAEAARICISWMRDRGLLSS